MASCGKRAMSDRRETYLRRPEEDDGPARKKMRKALIDIFNRSSLCLKFADERMSIFLRAKPFTKEDEDNENQNCFVINEEDDSVVAVPPEFSHTYRNMKRGLGKTSHKFTFSRVFNDKTSQAEFFNATMLDRTKEFISGQNSLVFSYGVTSSGKTFTIQGQPQDAGILPRCLDVLFNSINNQQINGIKYKPHMFTDVMKLSTEEEETEKKLKQKLLRLTSDTTVMSLHGEDSESVLSDTMASCASSTHDDALTDVENRVRENVKLEVNKEFCYSIWVSFAEIYNEQIYDLLVPISKKNIRRPTLKICDDRSGSPYIKGLREVHVESADEAFKLLTIGQHNLQTASTRLNQCSSRSHSIFTIKMIHTVDKEDPNIAKMNMLSLCDLAGSERSNQTKVNGERLKEAGNINNSLMTLSRCIDSLRYNQVHRDNPKMVPFRESKLTRLFQNFFNGSGRAAMIVNVSQCASLFDETLNVFKFSAIAKQVKYISKPPEHRMKKKVIPPSQRPSIPWADPEKETMFEEATNEALPEEEEEEDENDETDIESVCSVSSETVLQMEQQIKMLMDKNAQLAEMWKEEVINSGNIEMRVRKEVTAAMNKQMVLMEKTYSDILRESREDAQENLEGHVQSVIDIYEEKLEKVQHKVDEEDEWVSSCLFYREEMKVKERDEKITMLETENEKLKASSGSTSNQDTVINSLTHELSELKTLYKETSEQLIQQKQEMESLEVVIQGKDSTIMKLEEEQQKEAILITSLNQELEDMKTQCQEIDDQLNQQKKEMESLQKDMDLKMENKDSTIKMENKDSTIKTQQEEFHGHETVINSLTHDLSELKTLYKETSEQLIQQKQEIESLQVETDLQIQGKDNAMRILEEEQQKQETVINSLTHDLSELRTLYKEASEQLIQQKQEIESLQVETDLEIQGKDSTIRTLEEEQQKQETVINSLTHDLSELRTLYKEASEQLIQQKQEIESLQVETDLEIQGKDSTIRTLEEEQQTQETVINSLTHDLSELRTLYKEASEQLIQQKQEIESLQVETDLEIQGKDSTIRTLEDEHQKQAILITSLNQELEDMKTQCQETDDQLNQQKKEMESLQKDMDLKMENKDSTIKTLEEECQEKQETVIQSLTQELNELKTLHKDANEQLIQQKQEMESLQIESNLEIHGKDSTIRTLEEEWQQKQETIITSLKEELKETKTLFQQAEDQLNKKRQEIETLQMSKDSVDTTLEEESRSNQGIQKSNTNDLSAKLKASELANAALRSKLKKEEEDFLKMEQALIHGYTSQINNLQEELVKQKCKFEANAQSEAINKARMSSSEILCAEICQNVEMKEESRNLCCEVLSNEVISLRQELLSSITSYKQLQLQDGANNTNSFIHSVVLGTPGKEASAQGMFQSEDNVIDSTLQFELTESVLKIEELKTNMETQMHQIKHIENEMQKILGEKSNLAENLRQESEKRLVFENILKEKDHEIFSLQAEIKDRNEKLNSDLEKAASSSKHFENTLQEMKLDNYDLKTEAKERASEVEQYESEIKELNFKLEETQREKMDKDEMLDDISTKLQLALVAKSNLSDELRKSETNIEQLETELQARNKEVHDKIIELNDQYKLKIEYEKKNETYEHCSLKMRKQIETLSCDKRTLEGELQKSRTQFEKEYKSTSEIKQKLELFEREKVIMEEVLNKKLNVQELELQEANSQLSNVIQEKKNLQEEIEKIKGNHQEESGNVSQKLLRFEREKRTMEKNVSEAREKIQVLHKKCEDLGKIQESEQKLRSELKSTSEAMVKHSAKSSELKEELATKGKEFQQFKEEIEEMKCQTKKLQSENYGLLKEKELRVKAETLVSETSSKLSELRQGLYESEEAMEKQDKIIIAQDKRIKELESGDEEVIHNLKTEMNKTESAKKDLEIELSKQEVINKKAREEMEKWKKERDHFAGSLEIYMNKLKNENEELTQDIEKLKRDNADMAKSVVNTSSAKDALIAELRKSNNTLSIQLASVQGLSPPPKIATPKNIFPMVKDFDVDMDTTTRIEIDATPPIAAKKLRKRTGSRKNSSSSVDPDENNIENQAASKKCLRTIEEREESLSDQEKHPLRNTKNFSSNLIPDMAKDILSGFSPLTRSAKKEQAQKTSKVKPPFEIQPYDSVTEPNKPGIRQSSRLRKKQSLV